MSNLGIVSDLHLAPRGMSRCSANEDALLALLDTMEAEVDRIIVAGDLYDLSRPLLPLGWRSWLEEIRLAYPRFVGRIESHERVFGNHDIWLRKLGTPESIDIDLDGWRVRVQHGHQYDVPMKQIRPLEALGNYVAGWAMRGNLNGVAEGIGQLPVVVESLRRKNIGAGSKAVDRSAEGARSLLQSSDVDVLVMGHSHRLRRIDGPGGTFVNTGSICCGHVDWVKIDGAERSIALIRDGRLFAADLP